MNKFYENYKHLFQIQNKSRPSGYFTDKPHKKDWTLNYRSNNHYEQNIFNNNSMNNQFKRLFNQQSINEPYLYRLKTQQSPAGKQLKDVILPKLNFYDKQIEKKLKRFKTQQRSNQNHSDLFQNKSSFHPENIYEQQFRNTQNKPIRLLKFTREKYHPKVSLSKSKINQTYETILFETELKSAGKPSRNLNQQSYLMNPQNSTLTNKNQLKKLKSSQFISQIPYFLDKNETNFESQYQRSYSNKKIKRLKQLKDSNLKILMPQDVVNLTSEQKNTLPIEELDQCVGKSVKKRQKNMKKCLASEEGLKFSQYENQFAFINKRLNDIQNFDNYYSHNCINSYKKAIMRRLDVKKNQQNRRNKLKLLLTKEQLSYQTN